MAHDANDGNSSLLKPVNEHAIGSLEHRIDQSREFEETPAAVTGATSKHHSTESPEDGLDKLEQLSEVDWAALQRDLVFETCPPGHPERSRALNDLASAFLMRFNQSGNHTDLENAVLLHDQALEILPPDHPQRSLLLNNLANAVFTRFNQLGIHADLDRAVLLHEQGLELHPPGYPGHATSLHNLANAVRARFEQLGHITDLDRAVLLHEQAIELHPPSHPHHSASLNGLANAVITRFYQSGSRADLDRAVLLHEQALEFRPLNHPDRSGSLNNLANAVSTRFEQSGNPADLESAVLLHEQALELHPPGHPQHSTSLNNLAGAVSVRFRHLGNRVDLDRAVLLHEQAHELHPPGHPERSGSLNNLASAVLMRFNQSGSRADLDRAVLLHEQALELHPPSHPQHSTSLNNLATAVLMHSKQSGKHADLDRAVLLHEQALKLCPPSHPYHSMSLNNLAKAVQQRFEHSKNCADLDRAVLLYEQALEQRPPGHPSHSLSLYHLAAAVLTRYEQSENPADLEQALHWCHYGLETVSDTDVHRSDLLTVLGSVYAAQSSSSDLPSDVTETLGALSRGAQSQFAPLPARFKAAGTWLLTAIIAEQTQSAITACRIGITLLPQLLWLELDLASRLAALKHAAGLVAHGAACAVQVSMLTEAVELLEGGRGIFWTHTLQLRSPPADLPLLFVQKFTDLSHALRSATLEDSTLEQPLSAERAAAETFRRRELVVEWSQMLKEIRNTTGFEHFLLPRPFRELAEAAQGGPVIILNASTILGCDAVVIKSPQSPPAHVALPSMTFARLEQLRAGLKQKTRGDTARYMELALPESDLDFREIFEELWTSVAKPIVDFLGLEKSDNPTRLWWCPTSLFTFMPIHAAGIYNADGSTSMLEYAISSYIPTLDTLVMARSRAARFRAASVGTDKVLVIVQPDTPGHTRLPWTIEERKCIQKVVSPSAFLHLNQPGDSHPNESATDGSDATVENVLSRLPEASIVHFACHGTQSKDPLKSALHLQDGQLTLDRIIHRDLPNASIAYLSACHSAAGDDEQPDEMVHLGAAMLTAGYQSVIATMWSMGDKDGHLVAEEVYTRLFSSRPDPRCAAHALHAAVLKLRDTGADFASWVPFIHLGV